MARAAEIRIGISGWTYSPWRGSFFPKGLLQRGELAYASSIFPSIEINGTFYGLQRPAAFAAWAEQVPGDFVFAVKGSRFITHIKRARDVAIPLANFFASGLLRLGPKLGPILWQFPPNFRFDPEVMRNFLGLLPYDTTAATRLARKHDHRIKARAWLKSDAERPIWHAIEIRHESFVNSTFVDLLRDFNVAFVCADTVAWPRLMDLTSDFVYCRLHGSTELYRSGYDAAAINEWANRVRAWAAGKPMRDGKFAAASPERPQKPRDVFVYFDNTDKLRAPQDAQALMRKLEGARSDQNKAGRTQRAEPALPAAP
jgi:uncharacterized protein YecE (DUF72 family)